MTWLKSLYSPLALGLYITVTMVGLCFSYYTSKDKGEAGGILVQSIRKAHEVSIDYRLQLRGPIKPKSPVVILTIDQKALDTIGRWPWPREVLANATDKAMALGAKVIAFDIIFGEAERNDLLAAVEELRNSSNLTPAQLTSLEQRARDNDGDTKLSAAFEKHRSHIVGGTYYQNHYDDTHPGEMDFCLDLVFRMTPEFKIWDNEEVLVSVQDPFQIAPPAMMSKFFSQILNSKKEAIEKKFSKKDLTTIEKLKVRNQVINELRNVCTTILDDAKAPLSSVWNQEILTQMNPADFNFPTYESWRKDFREKSFPNGVLYVDGWDVNTPELSSHLSHNGYFNATQDSDGTIRSSSLVVRTGNFYFPTTALKAYLIGMNRNASLNMNYNPATGRKEIVDFEITDNNTGDVVEKIPTDGQGRMLINYAGPRMMFPHVSVSELLSESDQMEISQRVLDSGSNEWIEKNQTVDKKSFFKDKYILLGPTATGIFDLRVTPFDKKNYPGVETHANVLGNLLEKNFLKPWVDERANMPFLILGLGIVQVILLSQLGALGGMMMTLMMVGGILGLDKFYLFDKGIVVTIVWPLFLLLLIYLILTTYRYLTEERGKKELRETFQKYVSPAIVEEILSDPKNIELGGKKVNLTIFFSDVRGFTTISERLDPQALSNLLNSYLTPMTEIIFKNQGTLDKYMGDAIMAFFGAPIAFEKHAHFACRAALQSLEKLFELQKQMKAQGLPQIDIGIGLNTGDVSAGNMGSQTVRSYTVMGDAVNLASRLEGINKEYGTRIIISEFTYKEVSQTFSCREVDWVRVKGKLKPVKIYELIKEGPLEGPDAEFIKLYQEAYAFYRQSQWGAAELGFTKCLNLNPEDALSNLFLERSQAYIQNPPPDGWDGVFEMKTK